MQEVFLQRKNKNLVATSQHDQDEIKKLPQAKMFRAVLYDVKNPRSVRQLNMFFACCQTVADNTEDKYWNTKEKVAFQVKVALQFINLNETIVDPQGKVHFKYRSISFDELPHMEACDFFNRAWEVLAAKIGVTVEKLLENSQP